MKRCPQCRRDYFDDSLLYCLDDGSGLLEGPASGSSHPQEPATAIMHETASPGEAATRAQVHTTDQTSVLPTTTPKSGFDKRLIAGILLGVIVLGGFLGYRYVASDRSEQISS